MNTHELIMKVMERQHAAFVERCLRDEERNARDSLRLFEAAYPEDKRPHMALAALSAILSGSCADFVEILAGVEASAATIKAEVEALKRELADSSGEGKAKDVCKAIGERLSLAWEEYETTAKLEEASLYWAKAARIKRRTNKCFYNIRGIEEEAREASRLREEIINAQQYKHASQFVDAKHSAFFAACAIAGALSMAIAWRDSGGAKKDVDESLPDLGRLLFSDFAK
jgi:hypothetical protein